MRKLISAICAVLISVGTLGLGAGAAGAAPAALQKPVEISANEGTSQVQKVDHRRWHHRRHWDDRRWHRRRHWDDRRWSRRHHHRRWDRHDRRYYGRHHRWDRRYYDRPYRHTGSRIILEL
ncbi:hypothetical protein M8997_014385 [Phyllobacterium sp. 21LDTY02-6]|jgi:hypothetical protein|uniref:hypothetical protein n=1 Tax=Phyllobacterium sp. 21LDTY02-6 TaxID=2944903 RepID=UPI00201FD565|nr:hypothetical protein [Phyllobacterium sp. 21LDTY02-6]MCO4318381.1 hypothetical protein [Phyllobacterium sp. 21LDTY02-6]